MSCESLEAKNFDVEVETIGIAGGISRHLRLQRSSSKEFRWRFTARQISVEALCRKGYFQTNWRCRKGPARNSISMRSEELPSSCIKQIITAKINNNRTKKYQLRQSGIAQRLDASSPEDKHCWLFCVSCTHQAPCCQCSCPNSSHRCCQHHSFSDWGHADSTWCLSFPQRSMVVAVLGFHGS